MANHLKIEPLKDYMDKYNLHPKEILYMGDDIPDVAPMKLVGLPTCPQDAVPEVKAVARYISHLGGGQGCVREVIEQVNEGARQMANRTYSQALGDPKNNLYLCAYIIL